MTIQEYLIDTLSKAKKSKPTTNSEICSLINNYFGLENKEKITPIKVREMINILRQDGMPIIANSRGYYISYDNDDILTAYESLINRSNSIIRAANGLKKALKPVNE